MQRPATLALVTARGGSQSIPRKNIKPLGGRPLIEWVLAAAAKSGVVDRTVVSTDADDIASVARAAGADVPFIRPPELAGDDTPSIDVIEHALIRLEESEGYTPELVLLLQPTEPFVRPEQIRDALTLLLEREADSAITFVEVPRTHHPFHLRAMDENGFLSFLDPDSHYAHPTRQTDPPRYAFGNLRWFRREAFLATRRIEAGRRVGLRVNDISAVDLNSPEDWLVAEALVQAGAV